MFHDLPIWAYLIVALVVTHITIAAVTIFLHRNQTHRALELHPLIGHFFRFWLWLTTGMVTKEWVAIHRKHHAKVESEADPHSPQIFGIKKVLFEGAELYRREATNQKTLEQYGHGTPDDWIEHNLYSRFPSLGIGLMLMIDVALFGFIGITIWAIQMAWIPFFAAGVINGVGHWRGYRNFESSDASTNIIPLGILIGGEELHNNHHAFASSAKFSNKWFEFDLGWYYIRALEILRLARVKKTAQKPLLNHNKVNPDEETVRAIVTHRMYVMADYAKEVVKQVYKEEKFKTTVAKRKLFIKSKRLLIKHEILLDPRAKIRLEELFKHSHTLQIVYEFRQTLQTLWQEKTTSQEALLVSLQEWCSQAEATGIEALQEFAAKLKAYSLQPATVR